MTWDTAANAKARRSRSPKLRKPWTHYGVGTVLLRYCYGIAPMCIAQLADFEQVMNPLRFFAVPGGMEQAKVP